MAGFAMAIAVRTYNLHFDFLSPEWWVGLAHVAIVENIDLRDRNNFGLRSWLLIVPSQTGVGLAELKENGTCACSRRKRPTKWNMYLQSAEAANPWPL